MKKSVLISFLFLLSLIMGLGVTSHARQTTKAPVSAEAIERDDSLNLTDEQKDKIKSIRADAAKQVQDIQKDKTLTPDQQTQKVKQITKETRAQVFAVLTPEQQKTWSAEQRERREQKKQAAK